MEYWQGGESDLFVHHSPIYVYEIRPLKTGRGVFELVFYHANYPEGVQTKEYVLRTLKRSAGHLVAERPSDDGNAPTVLLHGISGKWLDQHFPHFFREVEKSADVQAYLNRRFPGVVAKGL